VGIFVETSGLWFDGCAAVFESMQKVRTPLKPKQGLNGAPSPAKFQLGKQIQGFFALKCARSE
jgi:hypothetical protein